MKTSLCIPRDGNRSFAGGREIGIIDSPKVKSRNVLEAALADWKLACNRIDASDDELITAAQEGDQLAFMELCRRHSSMVKNKILRIVQNREDAEDVMQDTLLRAFLHLSSFRRSCKFSTWVTSIAVNAALMLLRKRRVRREHSECASNLCLRSVVVQETADRSPGPDGIYLEQQESLLVRRAIEKLHPNLRSLFNHYYGSEASLEEVAKAQEISLAAAKSRLLRGRTKLRFSLARHGLFKYGDRSLPSR